MQNILVFTLVFVAMASATHAASAKRAIATSTKVKNNYLFDQVIISAKKNKVEKALALLGQIKADQHINADLLTMTKARLFFQMGKLDSSDKVYSEISKSSDYWFEAQEERAHINGRRADFSKALEQLQTVMTAPFESVVGPEPYFVAALTSLRICDYSAVFKTNENFKKRFSPRIERLNKLTKSGVLQDEAVKKLLAAVNDKNPLSFESVGVRAKELPRNLHRDRLLRQLSIKSQTAYRDRAMSDRIYKLARQELVEINNIISQLQIVEAEAIQNIYLAEGDSGERKTQGSIEGSGDVLVFAKTDEVWLDELTHYAVQIEKCPRRKQQNIRASNKKGASL